MIPTHSRFRSLCPPGVYPHTHDSEREMHSHMQVWKQQEAETEADGDFLTTACQNNVIRALVFVHLLLRRRWGSIFSIPITTSSGSHDLRWSFYKTFQSVGVNHWFGCSTKEAKQHFAVVCTSLGFCKHSWHLYTGFLCGRLVSPDWRGGSVE